MLPSLQLVLAFVFCAVNLLGLAYHLVRIAEHQAAVRALLEEHGLPTDKFSLHVSRALAFRIRKHQRAITYAMVAAALHLASAIGCGYVFRERYTMEIIRRQVP